jgi:hypothetical protein
VLGRGEPLDREAVRRERRSADDLDPWEAGQDLAGAVVQQARELRIDEGDVLAQRCEPVDVAGEPQRPQMETVRPSVCEVGWLG